jgi:hypothetical protein
MKLVTAADVTRTRRAIEEVATLRETMAAMRESTARWRSKYEAMARRCAALEAQLALQSGKSEVEEFPLERR